MKFQEILDQYSPDTIVIVETSDWGEFDDPISLRDIRHGLLEAYGDDEIEGTILNNAYETGDPLVIDEGGNAMVVLAE